MIIFTDDNGRLSSFSQECIMFQVAVMISWARREAMLAVK